MKLLLNGLKNMMSKCPGLEDNGNCKYYRIFWEEKLACEDVIVCRGKPISKYEEMIMELLENKSIDKYEHSFIYGLKFFKRLTDKQKEKLKEIYRRRTDGKM